MLTLQAVLLAATLIAAGNPAPPARWNFDKSDAIPFVAHGAVERGKPGPRPPEFPAMAADNTAVRMPTRTYLAVQDTGKKSIFDFTNGDAITMEAWVNPASIRDGQVCYIIGKGRTGSPEFARDNQNWSLRIVGAGGEARLSLMFATKLTSSEQHWHRWDSQNGFPAATGWYHIAIAYRFGDPKSVRGWINGKPTSGAWSYGGETKELPIVDNDEIRIGNGFAGLVDAIAIHRSMLDDKTVAAKFQRVGKPRIIEPPAEIMPTTPDIAGGKVLMQIFDGLQSHTRWPANIGLSRADAARWTGDTFLLPRIPLQHDSWGIRSAWNAPVLLRMAGDVKIPAGRQRFLMRARSLGRLWINGEVVARTMPVTGRPPDGEERVIPAAKPLLKGVRVHGYRQQEVSGEATIQPGPDGKSRVVLEIIVGGRGYRTETGEVCVAMLSENGRSYELLSTAPDQLLLTDAAVEPALVQIEKSLAELDDQRRHAAAASEDEFWRLRHKHARDWSKTKRPVVPGAQGLQPVDAFINARIKRAQAASAGSGARQATHFHNKVLPLLREHCFRCHGEKDKGGLKLNSRKAALQGGDSDIPAVVPGDLNASELVARITSHDEDLRMPPTGSGLSKPQIALLKQWVKSGAAWPAPPLDQAAVLQTPVIDDAAFLRRIYLDTAGMPPTADEARAFFADTHADKRNRLINKLLADERFAGQWMSFWLDLLAENPSLLNASLNSTGPFRWFLYDSLRDNKPLDRMVTELLMLRGGAAEGGSAGFGIAAENDSPLAAKGHIIASAFLGVELQCARCHDSPYHSTTQKDLYSLAAMFKRKPLQVPASSRVPAAFFEIAKVRKPLIQVTLKPNQYVAPAWPFAELTSGIDKKEIDRLMHSPADTRERLAALITAPQNMRFPRVMVNRIWKRLIGTGIVEPVHDWEGQKAADPALLDWLAHELIANNYDVRHIVKTIVTSKTYQRTAVQTAASGAPDTRFFNAPQRRRLSAEQIVDSLHQATGRPFDVEELTFVHDGRRALGSRQTLGRPTRAWMFGDLKNERDRPSLSLPKARAVADVLVAFGWTGSRQMPVVTRTTDANILQPGILANGTLSVSLTRAAHNSELANLAVAATSPQTLVDTLFLQILTRLPAADERKAFSLVLAKGFDKRLTPADKLGTVKTYPRLPQVTWFNHARPKANEIQLELERRAEAGPQPDPRLTPDWRASYEDVVWSLINHREFVWMP